MERQSFKLLGINLGTGRDWDYADDSHWWIYNFEPAQGLALPACDLLNIKLDVGLFEACAADGSIESSTSIVGTIYNAAPHNPVKVRATVNVDDITETTVDSIFPDTISLRQLLSGFGEYTSLVLVITKP